MSAFAAIFAREFRLRRVLLIGALAIGLMAQIIPRLQGQSGANAAETAADAALLLSLLTCGIFALVLGSGAVVRDLVDGRLGFDFVRPISGFSIWAGRIGAAVTLLFASAVLVVAPAFLVGWLNHSFPPKEVGYLLSVSGLGAAWTFGASLLACLVLLFLTHVGVLLFASRSAALGLDLAGLLAVGLLVGAALTRLYRNWARDALNAGWISYLALFLIVLIGATLVQLLVGRTDLARSHRVLSIALWVPLLLGALVLDATSRWIVSPGISDVVRNVSVAQAPVGNWFSVGGELRGRGALAGQFLVDAATGRVLRQGVSLPSWPISATFSSDGKSAAWLVWLHRGTEVRWVDLSASVPKVESAPISLEGVAEVPSLSPNGRWLALRSSRRMLVFELRTGRLVNSIPVTPDWDTLRIRWIAENRLRFWSAGGNADASLESRISVAEIQVPGDPGNSAPIAVGTVPRAVHDFAWDVSRDGATVIVRENETGRRYLFDGRTGAALGEIHEGTRSGGVLLADGSVVINVWTPESRSLAIYDRTGVLRRRFNPPSSSGLQFGAQPSPSTILASTTAGGSPGNPELRRLWLLNLTTGGMREVGRGWIPVSHTVGSEAPIVLIGPTSFARWDPATETLKPIVLH